MSSMEQQQQDPTVSALNLGSIKDVDKLSIRPEGILIEAVKPKESKVILPEGQGISSVTRLEIIKVGDKVDNYKVGDVVLDFMRDHGLNYYYKDDRNFILTDKHNIALSTEKENYTK